MINIEKLNLNFVSGTVAKASEVLQLPDKINEIIDVICYEPPTNFLMNVSVSPSEFYYGQVCNEVEYSFTLASIPSYLRNNLSGIKITIDGENKTLTSLSEPFIIKKTNVSSTTQVNAVVEATERDNYNNAPNRLDVKGSCNCVYACACFTSNLSTLTSLPSNVKIQNYNTNTNSFTLTNTSPAYFYIAIPSVVSVNNIKIDVNSALSNASLLEKQSSNIILNKVGTITLNNNILYKLYRSGFLQNAGTIYYKIS